MQSETGIQDRPSNREKKLLYHLTALGNLEGILEHGLLSRGDLLRRGLLFGDVADPAILEKRALNGLDQMVPFHFVTRNPFDYGVIRASPDRQFVIVAVRRSLAASNGWKVIPLHPLTTEGDPVVYEWAEGFERIEWAEMDKFPRDFERDRLCKMTCMAEALSPDSVTVEQWACVFVANEATRVIVEHILPKGLNVTVNPHMFPKRGT